MSFSLNDCVVVRDRFREKGRDCFSALGKYEYCLTPKVKECLFVWLNKKIRIYGCEIINGEDVYNAISELLCNCCHKSQVELVMRRDVNAAEIDILKHIKNAIRSKRTTRIYNEKLVTETKNQYERRTSIRKCDVSRYTRGVIVR